MIMKIWMVPLFLLVFISLFSVGVLASTTLTLQDSETELVEDTFVNASDSTTNYGSNTLLYVNNSSAYVYYKFIISGLPSSVTINWANFTALQNHESGQIWDVRHVYNQTWIEDTITWDDQPCDSTFDNSAECNMTVAHSRADDSSSATCDSMAWSDPDFDVTDSVKVAYVSGDVNISFIFNTTSTTCDSQPIIAKEHAGANPILKINYDYQSVPTWDTNQSSFPSEYNPTSQIYYFNISLNTTDTSISEVSMGILETNVSGVAVNYTMNNTTYGGVIYNYTLSFVTNASNFYWKVYVNDTVNNIWNTSDTWTFTLAKNSTNPTNVVMSNNDWATNVTNANISVTAADTVNMTCTMDYSLSGTCKLYVDGTEQTTPYGNTFGVGDHTIIANTTGNDNYTTNSSTYYIIASAAGVPTGGGAGPSDSTDDPNTFEICSAFVGQECIKATDFIVFRGRNHTEEVFACYYKSGSIDVSIGFDGNASEWANGIEYMIVDGVKIFDGLSSFKLESGECKTLGLSFSIPENVSDGIYIVTIQAWGGGHKSSVTMQFLVGIGFGTLGDILSFVSSKMAWNYTIEGDHPIDIPYAGLLASVILGVAAYIMIKSSSVRFQYKNKYVPYLGSLLTMGIVLMLIP